MGMDGFTQRHQIIAAPHAASKTIVEPHHRHHNHHHQTVGKAGLPVVSNHSSSSSSEEGDRMMNTNEANNSSSLPLGHYQNHGHHRRPDHCVDHDYGIVSAEGGSKKIAVDTARPAKKQAPNVPLTRPITESFSSLAPQNAPDNTTTSVLPSTSPTNSGGPQFVAISRQHDPHNIYERFVRNHLVVFNTAYTEIRQGQKRSHWVWFIFPTSPYVVNGVERGSKMNRHFALRSDDAVIAFLNYKHTTNPQQQQHDGSSCYYLRNNYIMILSALVNQLHCGNTLEVVFGKMDYHKVLSSIKLFRRVGMELILKSDLEKQKPCGSNDDTSATHDDMNGSSYRELVMLCNKVLELAVHGSRGNANASAVSNHNNNKMKRDSNHSSDGSSSSSGGGSSGENGDKKKKLKKKKRSLFRRW